MAHDHLALRTARTYVRNYASEGDELMSRHIEAMDCRDCEAFLQLAIDAFHWLNRADCQIRLDVFEGRAPHDPSVDEALTTLYRLWLRPCDTAERWISLQLQRGYTPDNLDEYRDSFREVKALVAPSDEVAGQIEAMRDQAIEDYQAGRTEPWGAEEPSH